MITFSPTVAERAIWDKAQRYATDVLAARAAEHDAGRFPVRSVRELAGLGLMGIKSPVEYGGLGGTTVAYVGALRAIANACASTAVTMAVSNMTGEMIARFGTEQQKDEHLRKPHRGRASESEEWGGFDEVVDEELYSQESHRGRASESDRNLGRV